MGRRVKDITGLTFNKLLVLSLDEIRDSRCYWLCQCDCGNVVSVLGSSLKRGGTKSCGCLKTKHGHAKDRGKGYGCWSAMKARCENPNHPSYNSYGGSGLSVCDSWSNSFKKFLDDMGERPSKNHSIHRIDNGKGYYKENCIWATASDQARNRSDTVLSVEIVKNVRLLKSNGLKMYQICEKYPHIKRSTLAAAYYDINWKTL